MKIDFLPIHRRTLQREGIVLDHILYYSTALSSLMPRRYDLGKLLIRRDPRDLSEIYVSDPDGKGYIRVPYRNIHRPTINIHEHRAAMKSLKDTPSELSEQHIFGAIEDMRRIEVQGKRLTTKERRRRENRTGMESGKEPASPTNIKMSKIETIDPKEIEPFFDVERWL